MVDEGATIKRRRNCEKCGERFTTYERLDITQLMVIKRNGVREVFDRSKILRGIISSCNKRSISVGQIEKLTDEIEAFFMNSMRGEVESSEIGTVVMERLRKLDEVAYVRFASVYKQFKDIDTFMDELSVLLMERKET